MTKTGKLVKQVMEKELLDRLGSWVVIIVLMGSIVDIFQFVWIVKRWFNNIKVRLKRSIERDILGDMYFNGTIKNKTTKAPTQGGDSPEVDGGLELYESAWRKDRNGRDG